MPESTLTNTAEPVARRRRKRPWLVVSVGVVLALGIAAAGAVFAAEFGGKGVQSPEAHAPRFTAGAVLPLADPVPPGALFVAAGAAPRGDGSIGAPFATVDAALDRVRGSGTIVLRGGVYHESVFVGASKQVTIRSYPGEEVVFDGSVALTEWTPDDGTWIAPWTLEFDSSPSYNRGTGDGEIENWQFLDPAYPMAAHPDQLWIDGDRMQQVATAADVDASSFAVDTARGVLVIGTDPSGREVRASDLQNAFTVRSPGSTLSGLTVRRYAPSIPDMGSIVIEGDGDRIVDVAVEDSSTAGVFVTGTGSTLERVTIRDSGLIGATANFADHLTLKGVLLTENNAEHFNQAPVSGGFKISRSQHLMIQDSVVSANDGHGIWLDQSVLDSTIVSSDVIDNAGHGVFAEISNRVLLADVVIAGNVRIGLKINDTGGVEVWRSTIVGNGVAVAILQDDRRASDPETPGHDERQPNPDPEMTWVIDSVVLGDNIIGDSLGSVRDGATGGDGYVWAQDYSGDFTAEDMGVVLTGNLFFRTADGRPPEAIVWQTDTSGVTSYRTLAAFSEAVPEAASNREWFGDVFEDAYRLTSNAGGAASTISQPPPEAVLALLGDRAVGVGAIPPAARDGSAAHDGSAAPGPSPISSVADPFDEG